MAPSCRLAAWSLAVSLWTGGVAYADVAALERGQNYPASSGRHSRLSPVPGAKAAELDRLLALAPAHPALRRFAAAIYSRPELFHLIAAADAEAADRLALESFLRHLAPYAAAGVTQDNAVDSRRTGMPGYASNKTWIHDVENEWNTWNVQVVVEEGGSVLKDRYLPQHLIAQHEIMHVEATAKGAPSPDRDDEEEEIFRKPEILLELAPALLTLVKADEFAKRVAGAPLERPFDHGMSVTWEGRVEPLGEVADFYRGLMERYGGMPEAVVSRESLRFIDGPAGGR